jgi:hypothetical protein
VTLGTGEKRELIVENLEEHRPDFFILDENIKMGLEAIEYEALNWRHISQDRIRYWDALNMVPQKYSRGNVNFSTGTLIQAIKLVSQVDLLPLATHAASQFRFQCYARITISTLVQKLSVAFILKCT